LGEISAAFDSFNTKLKEMSAAAKVNNPRLFGALSDEPDVATTALNGTSSTLPGTTTTSSPA